METEDTNPSHSGGIYNYFQGATINNLVINGNMTKSGPENYNSQSNSNTKYVKPEIIAKVIQKLKPTFWGNAAFTIQFCACRDLYGWQNNALEFERIMREYGFDIPEGTITNTIFHNKYMELGVDKWETNGAMQRVMTLLENFKSNVENVILPEKTENFKKVI